MNAKDHAHDRLLNAVVTFIGADQYGSKAEIRASVIEMHAAVKESQELLHPTGGMTATNQRRER